MAPLFPFRPLPHDCEWIGGRYELGEREVDVWLELPKGVLVGSFIRDPLQPVPFAASLASMSRTPVAAL